MFIKVENVTHIYKQGDEHKALDKVNLSIQDNEFIGLIGHTGSGKSTLVQLLNGLIKPTTGSVVVDGQDITKEKINLKEIRRKIGLVFQYPEHQLFEETVYDDIAFGPRNLGLSNKEIQERVEEAMKLVGLDFAAFKTRSPFNLSGGQQRKVAFAGVLAMKPQALILDEPSAGLDPQGREQLINLLKHLYNQYDMTIILISHRMEEIARLSSRVLVMNQGRIALDGSPQEVFGQVEKIRRLALDLPEITEILWRLKQKGKGVRTNIFTMSEAISEISREMRGIS
ncbi:energy-coupling factor transporter ATPase [Iocasia frigidifontis]|uniref:Energy-coupling factor transporter ATP-binding protein EcfA2 n=1 Tax=Iocasia fonsfrigidae TaxID=2682810 RepID=A0A8A7KDD0_9FIRM|nr:energy-coupling factor transporter ATPase [Iocasia fonsfrigidae]QTL99270.1 energy-coupling factor transporter ATPase [Iocasia fonsfrigidae]